MASAAGSKGGISKEFREKLSEIRRKDPLDVHVAFLAYSLDVSPEEVKILKEGDEKKYFHPKLKQPVDSSYFTGQRFHDFRNGYKGRTPQLPSMLFGDSNYIATQPEITQTYRDGKEVREALK